MPSRNTVKSYEPESMYHVYNRGVDKRIIFVDERDYLVFLSFLKYALLSDEELKNYEVIDEGVISQASRFNLRREGLHGSVELVSFCLMPNHFHLLLYQYDIDGITRLMRSVATGYVLYFNKRHKRVGTLFQGRYKASKINSQGYWDHISRYIHLNPLDINQDYKTYQYSSYRNYIGEFNAEWLKPGLVLDSFSSTEEYEKFVEEYIPEKEELKKLKELLANSRELEE
jgi:putative transposase